MPESRNTPTGPPAEHHLQVMGVGSDVVADLEDLRDTDDERPDDGDSVVWSEARQRWLYIPAGGGMVAHALGGPYHTPSTLAELNARISDANVDAAGTPRPPTAHTHDHNAGLTGHQGGIAAQRYHMTAAQHAIATQAAGAALAGYVTALAQTFGGAKSFNGALRADGRIGVGAALIADVDVTLGIQGAVAMGERIAAPGGSGNYGKFYVMNDTLPYFKDSAGVAHLLRFAGVEDATKEFTILGQTLNGALVDAGDFKSIQLDNGENVGYNFRVPHDFSSLTSADVIIIPDATETIQWDVETDYGAEGEAYNTHSESDLNVQLAVTNTILAACDVSGALAAIAAGDNVGLKFTSDISTLYTLFLRIKYA